MVWPYQTPGIPDHLFEQLPGIPLSKKEVRLLIISALRMNKESILWDIGAGTGTVAVEVGLLCPKSTIIAIERDEDVANLVKQNCRKFGVNNVEVLQGTAPQCLKTLKSKPDRVCIEGGKDLKEILKTVWQLLPMQGRVVATVSSLENLYILSEGLANLQARQIEVVQSAVNRLEQRGISQTFAAVDPIFILSGEKL